MFRINAGPRHRRSCDGVVGTIERCVRRACVASQLCDALQRGGTHCGGRFALEFHGIAGRSAPLFVGVNCSQPIDGRWMFGRTFGLVGRESYRELRLELLCCPHL